MTYLGYVARVKPPPRLSFFFFKTEEVRMNVYTHACLSFLRFESLGDRE